MPALNKQTLINLLIDSPLREPIKINLIDIVNNTNDADLPKTFSTISKELEIYQKATERRMKLADETIAKLRGEEVPASAEPATPAAAADTAPTPTTAAPTDTLPPLPPLPTPPASLPKSDTTVPAPSDAGPGLAAPSLDLPPMPKTTAEPAAETVTPAAPVADATVPPQASSAADADEDALKEIQKELDSLKASATEEAAPAPAAAAAPTA